MDESGNIRTHGKLTDELNALLDEVEESTTLRTKLKNRIFNQPTLLTISSANALPLPDNTTQWNQQGFSSFTCNFARPALDVESVQLVSSNIPNANCNIPDTACVFWYYRLSQYSGMTPCLDNLFMVRLLPSYYKPEFCGTYGQNVFFQNYNGVATQLALSCAKDLAADNYETIGAYAPSSDIPFNANDITLTYNTTLNKFQMTGQATDPVLYAYSSDNTYAAGALVFERSTGYISLQGSNTANLPSTSPTWWSVYSGEIMVAWDSGTTYPANAYVSYNGSAYNSGTTYNIYDIVNYLGVSYYSTQVSNTGNTPSTTPSYWSPFFGIFSSLYSTNLDNQPNGAPPSAFTIGSSGSSPTINITNTSGATTLAVGTKVVIAGITGTTSFTNGTYYVLTSNSPTTAITVSTTAGGSAVTFTGTITGGYGIVSFWTIVTSSNTNTYNWYYYLPAGPSDPLVQQAQGGQFYQQWNSTTLYQTGDNVQYNGLWYSALQQNVGQTPSASIYWNNYAYNSGNTYNEGEVVLYIPPLYNVSTTYAQNAVVTYLGISYYSLQSSNTGHIPSTSPAWWTAFSGNYYFSISGGNTGNTPYPFSSYWGLDSSNGILPNNNLAWSIASPIRGLNYLSSQFDMLGYFPSINTYILAFPAEIPPQPFNTSPKRILNTILGFTWNGLFNPVWVANAFTAGRIPRLIIGSQQASFFNRFRPVLPYLYATGGSLLGEVENYGNAGSTLVYTAESYCNLLYSSVVNLYSNFLTSGSLDTQKINNLIACAPLAAPLGLTTFNAYVDNPITRVMPDIGEMTISMFDEFGEPYYLPLSAVATLVFKLRYKE